jgi:TPR repeat protein
VGHDVNAALEWFRKSAEQGNVRAQNSLGFSYEMGRGCERNMTAAVQWYRMAAEGGNTDAQCNLASCYERGCGCDADCAAAAEKYATAGDIQAGANIAGFLKVADAMLAQGVCY